MLLAELRRLLQHPLQRLNRTRTATRSLQRGCFQPPAARSANLGRC